MTAPPSSMETIGPESETSVVVWSTYSYCNSGCVCCVPPNVSIVSPLTTGTQGYPQSQQKGIHCVVVSVARRRRREIRAPKSLLHQRLAGLSLNYCVSPRDRKSNRVNYAVSACVLRSGGCPQVLTRIPHSLARLLDIHAVHCARPFSDFFCVFLYPSAVSFMSRHDMYVCMGDKNGGSQLVQSTILLHN